MTLHCTSVVRKRALACNTRDIIDDDSVLVVFIIAINNVPHAPRAPHRRPSAGARRPAGTRERSLARLPRTAPPQPLQHLSAQLYACIIISHTSSADSYCVVQLCREKKRAGEKGKKKSSSGLFERFVKRLDVLLCDRRRVPKANKGKSLALPNVICVRAYGLLLFRARYRGGRVCGWFFSRRVSTKRWRLENSILVVHISLYNAVYYRRYSCDPPSRHLYAHEYHMISSNIVSVIVVSSLSTRA